MTSGDIKNDFKYHAPNTGQVEKYEAIRAKGLEMALLVYDSCPSSPEMTTAVRHVENAVMWANAAIARHSE